MEELKESSLIPRVGVESAKSKNHIYINLVSKVGFLLLSNKEIIDFFKQF